MKGDKGLILFVEDDAVDRISFQRFADQNEFSYRYKLAGSVKEAREHLGKEIFQAVVLDYMLGDGNAFDLFASAGEAPIVVVTGMEDLEIAVRAMKEGACDFIVKDSEEEYLKTLEMTIDKAVKRKNLEQEIVRYRENLEKTNARLKLEIEEKNILCRRLEDKTRELESFVRTASHDLKGPLVVLGGYSSALAKRYGDRLDDKANHYLELISGNVKRMENLIKDLLELSQIGKVVGDMEFVDVEEILYYLKKGLKKQLEEKNISMVIISPVPGVIGDRGRINQVFENLISNSIKFIGDNKNPVIEIGAREVNPELVCYYVKDNGIGINKRDREKVFKEFHRINEIDAEGTGIGLAIVKKIVEHHGGRVWVESEKGKGSTFYLELPLKNREDENKIFKGDNNGLKEIYSDYC